MEIRLATLNDVPKWMDLVRRVKDSFPGLILTEYELILRKKIALGLATAAWEQQDLVGGLLYSLEGKELEFLAVSPDRRNKGIATAMIYKMITNFKQGDQLTVITYQEGDAQGIAARRLYERLGFRAGELVTLFDYPCQKYNLNIDELKN